MYCPFTYDDVHWNCIPCAKSFLFSDPLTNGRSTTRRIPFLVWDCVWASTTGKLWPQNSPTVHKTFSFRHFFGFSLSNLGIAHIVRPHPDNWTRVKSCNKFANKELFVNKGSTIVFFIYMYLYMYSVYLHRLQLFADSFRDHVQANCTSHTLN